MIKPDSFQVFYTDDLQKTYDFWQQIGVELGELEADKFVATFAGLELHYVLDSTEPFADYEFAAKAEGRGQGVLSYFEVEDVARFHQQLSKLNLSKITEIRDNAWDGREFLFSDPNGYLFVAYQMN